VTAGIKWVLPTSYTRVSSAYGWRTHPVYGDKRFHHGIDLSASSSTPIVAVRDGTVKVATYSSSAGYYVNIDHGDSFMSRYLHMTHYIVSPGQKVSAGQVIGYVGSTGTSTGPHLHFGLYINGASVNPADYIRF
jgi:murein DD-endopeptidase MepM/ murein hydrolase activator NlpD